VRHLDSCSGCPAGKASSESGATSSDGCVDCAAGFASTAAGATSCVACAAGKYATWHLNDTEGGQGSPITSGARACNACPPGLYSSFAASVMCSACVAGAWTHDARRRAKGDVTSDPNCRPGLGINNQHM